VSGVVYAYKGLLLSKATFHETPTASALPSAITPFSGTSSVFCTSPRHMRRAREDSCAHYNCKRSPAEQLKLERGRQSWPLGIAEHVFRKKMRRARKKTGEMWRSGSARSDGERREKRGCQRVNLVWVWRGRITHLLLQREQELSLPPLKGNPSKAFPAQQQRRSDDPRLTRTLES
jgi:hypothetical protein